MHLNETHLKTTSRKPDRFATKTRLRPALFCLGMLFVCGNSRAQQSLQMATLYQESAELRATKTGNPDYYNLELGPLDLRFRAEMGVEFNDNVNYTDVNRQSDFILRPTVNVKALWPVTEQNSLSFSLGVGYWYYLKSSNLDSFFVSPGSDLTFLLHVGDVAVNFHDRLSIVNDVATVSGVAGTGNYVVLANTPGLAVDWDWHKIFFTAGYDHEMVTSLSSGLSQLDRDSDLFFLRSAHAVNPSSKLGLLLGGGLTDYATGVFANYAQFIAGPFYEAQITEYIKAKALVGLAYYSFSQSGAPVGAPAPSSYTGYSFDLSATHHLNEWFEHSTHFQHIYQAGYISDLIDLYHADYQASFLLTHDLTLSARLLYEHGKTIGGVEETFDQYGPAIGLARVWAQKWTARLDYSFLKRKSNVPGLSYNQNRVVLDVQYSF